MSGAKKANKRKMFFVILAELSYLLLVIALNFSVRYIIDDLQYKTQDTETIKELQAIEQKIIKEYSIENYRNGAISRFIIDDYVQSAEDAKSSEVRIYYKEEFNTIEIEKNDYILKVDFDKNNCCISSKIIDDRVFTKSIEEHIIATAIAMIIGLFYITFVRLRLSKIPSKITKKN